MRRVAVLALLLPGLACQQVTNPAVVTQQTFSHAAGSTDVVAVMPFSASPGAVRDPEAGVSSQEVANLVATFVSEALAAEGVRVIPPSDMELAFLNQSRAVPRLDPQAAVALAAEEFGATSVVMGQLLRWRERKGEALGAASPASVAFVMRLRQAPGGRRLWTSRFDHTQRTLTADPLVARKYPGGGTRFLTAAELARWGVRSSVTSLVEGQWRASK